MAQYARREMQRLTEERNEKVEFTLLTMRIYLCLPVFYRCSVVTSVACCGGVAVVTGQSCQGLADITERDTC